MSIIIIIIRESLDVRRILINKIRDLPLSKEPLVLACLLLLALVTALGCGKQSDSYPTDGPTVVATTDIVADIVRNVAGPDARVIQLIPNSASPHAYQASAKDRKRLDDANLVTYIGRHFEENLPIGEIEAQRFAFAQHTGRPGKLEEEAREAATGEEGHKGEGSDPHLWMDPTLVARALPALADALAKVDPKNRSGYRQRAHRYARRLKILDRQLKRTLAGVPKHKRKLVTSHDSLGYFTDRYNLRLVGTAFGLTPEAEPSASRIAKLVEDVKREKVSVVFAQKGDDPKVLRQVAREAKVRVVDDLLVESFSPRADSYVELLRYDVKLTAAALRS